MDFLEPEMKSERVMVDQRDAAALSSSILDKIRSDCEGKDGALVATCLVLLASTMLMSLGSDNFVKYGSENDLPSEMTQDGLDAMLSRMEDDVKAWEGRN